jgi:gluconolactonase
MRSPLLILAMFVGLLQAQQAQQGGGIVKLDSALDTIVPADAKLEKLADGFIYFEGRPSLEGPVWDRNGGYLLFSYLSGHAIDKWTPAGKLSVFLDLDPDKTIERTLYLSSGITLDSQGRPVYCTQRDRAVLRIEKNGNRTVLANQFEGKPLNSPNDLVYHSDGTLYFTAPGRPPAGSPYNVFVLRNGELHGVATPLASPNGIALSADEQHLYVNDIGKKTVWRFELQPDDMPANGRIWVDMNSNNDPPGGPDGMKVDLNGNVYDSGPGGLWILSPEGKHLGTILTRTPISNLAWGDADGKSLYVTTHTALYRIRLNIEGKRP